MIPGESLNLQAPIAEFLVPDDQPYILSIDYEQGSLALNDPTGGLQQATWQAYAEQKDIYVRKLPDGEPVKLLTSSEFITELSFTFDSNMRFQVVYGETDLVKFYWYDTAISQFVTTEYAGIRSPRLCLDDKRGLEAAARDILFFYIKPGDPETLCYRQQRDRYLTERTLAELPINILRLGRTGMAKSNRVQVEIITEGDPVYL